MAQPSNLTLERLLASLMKEREAHAMAKEELKGYTLESELLTDLKRAARDIRDQMKAEKKRLEEELLEDMDYQEAVKAEKEHREKAREISHELKEHLAMFPMKDDVASFDFQIEGEGHRIQLEKIIKMYINGKEQRDASS